MAEIAARAGVSRATVSIILSSGDQEITRFKPETVARVRQIAESMGYQANLMALSLRNPHPSFFGLILRGVAAAESISWHHQAFEGQFQAGVIEGSRAARIFPVLATQDSPREGEVLDRIRGVLNGGVFGAILRTPLPPLVEPIRRRIQDGFPAVIVFPDDAASFQSNTIDMDNLEAGRLAGELLHGAGRTRWLIIRDDISRQALDLRVQGAIHVATQEGASVHVVQVPSQVRQLRVVERLVLVLKDLNPDGIYVCSGASAAAALSAADSAAIRIPDHACLVGCDSSLWRPPGLAPITSVDVSWFTAGETAVQKMVEIRDREQSVFANITLPPLVRRGSRTAPEQFANVGGKLQTGSAQTKTADDLAIVAVEKLDTLTKLFFDGLRVLSEPRCNPLSTYV